MDVDNDLLLQFTCLGTTDRDDLIKQFKELTEQVEDEKAQFFLEMNNWNLQNSICAYFDFLSPSDLSMAIVNEPSCDDLTPNMEFVLTYILRNDGRATWPHGCYFGHWYGNFSTDRIFPVGTIQPGCETTVIISLAAPSSPGNYHCAFRLMTASHMQFGKLLNLSFRVYPKLEDTEEQRLSDELNASMALMDSTECKIMEEEPNTESVDVAFQDFTRPDHNIS